MKLTFIGLLMIYTVTIKKGAGTEGKQPPALFSVEVQAVLNTGFTGHLVLPGKVIRQLALSQEDSEEVSLGDGSVTQFSVHEVTAVWDDEERTVTALGADGDVC